MLEVFLVVDDADRASEEFSVATAVEQVQPLLVQAIVHHSRALTSPSRLAVKTVTTTDVRQWRPQTAAALFPLTLYLPETLQFSAQAVYQVCRDVPSLRQQVQQLGYTTGLGRCWLPIVLMAKGPLYGEVIGLAQQEQRYHQPVHLLDRQRQVLYQLGYRLLRLLGVCAGMQLAPPATYLMQFGIQGQEIYFDRLWPFPVKPAIASLGVQEPDLIACHWCCLKGLPILDLTVSSSLPYQVYEAL